MILLHASTAFLLLVLVGGQDPLWSPKVWWAKYLSNDLYTAGQLSANMVKFAQEGGFQSIISLTPLKTSYEWGHQEVLLNTTTQRRLANELGLYFELIRTRDSRWMQYSTIETFSEYYWKAPKPVLLHCDNSYAATFVGLAFFAKETMETGNYTDASEVMDTFYRYGCFFLYWQKYMSGKGLNSNWVRFVLENLLWKTGPGWGVGGGVS